MNMKLLTLFFILTLLGCAKDDYSVAIYQLESKFNIPPKNITTYQERNNLLIYILNNHPASPSLSVFDIKGKLNKSISLDEAAKVLGEIQGISIVNLTDFIVNSKNTNKICLYRNDKFFKFIDLNIDLNKYSLSNYEISKWYSNNNFIHNNLFYLLNLRPPHSSSEKDIAVYNYYLKNLFIPKIVQISNPFQDSIRCEYLVNNFYSSIIDRPFVNIDCFNFRILNNKMYILSNYSPNIKIDTFINGKLSESRIIQNIIPTINNPIFVDSSGFNAELSAKFGNENSFIFDFNESYNGKYYFLSSLKPLLETKSDNKYRDIEVKVLDKNLNLITKFEFNEQNFSRYITPTSNGFLQLILNESKKDNIFKFRIISFD